MEKNGDGLQVGWGDKKLTLQGHYVIIFVMILALGGLMIWLGTERTSEHESIRTTLDSRLKESTDRQDRVIEQMEITNYLLSKPEDQRPELNMPRVLRREQLLKGK